MERAIQGRYLAGFLLVLMAGKILATSLTIAIGGSGGVLAPSLFMGAMLGTAYGVAVAHLLRHVAGPAGAYGLIGMGAVYAAAARAPITAVLIIFELTGEYTIILPLMAAIALAAGASRLPTGDTIYTLKLHRRGVDLGLERQPTGAAPRRRCDAAPAHSARGRHPLDATVARLSAAPGGALPVIDPTGTLRAGTADADGQPSRQGHDAPSG